MTRRAVQWCGRRERDVVVLSPERAQPLLLIGQQIDHVQVGHAVVVAAVQFRRVFAPQHDNLSGILRVKVFGKVVVAHHHNVGVIEMHKRGILEAGICRQIVMVISPILFTIATIRFGEVTQRRVCRHARVACDWIIQAGAEWNLVNLIRITKSVRYCCWCGNDAVVMIWVWMWKYFNGGRRLVVAVAIGHMPDLAFTFLRLMLPLKQIKLSDEIVELFRVNTVEHFLLCSS